MVLEFGHAGKVEVAMGLPANLPIKEELKLVIINFHDFYLFFLLIGFIIGLIAEATGRYKLLTIFEIMLI